MYDLPPLSSISSCSPPLLVLCTTFLHCPLYRVALLQSSSCVRPSSTVLYIELLSSSPRLVYDLPPLSSISSCSPPVLVLCTTFLHCPLYRVALLQSSSCVRPSSTGLYIGLLSSTPRLVYDLPPLSSISRCSPPLLVCVRPSSTVLYIELLSSSPRLVYNLPPLSSISSCSPPVLVLCTTFLHCPLYRVALLHSSFVYDLPPLSSISSCSPPVLVLCTIFLHCPLYRVALLPSSSCVRPSSTVLYIELLSSTPRLVYDLPPLSSISGCSPPVLVLCTTFLHCPLYRVALLQSSSCVRPSSTVLYIELLSSSPRLVYDLPPLSSISSCSPPVLVLCTTFLHCPLYRVALLPSSSCVRPSSTVLYIELLSSSPRLVYDLPPLSSISSCSPPVLVLCTTFLHCPLYRVALLQSSSCVRPSSTVLYIGLLSSGPRLVYDLPPLSAISSCSPPVLILCTTFLHCPLYRVALLRSSSCVRPSSTVLYIELLSSSPRLVYDLPPLSSISGCSPPVLVLCTTFLHCPLYRVALLRSSSCVRPSSTVLYIELLSSSPRLVYDLPPLSSISGCSPPVLVLCTTFLHCPLYRVALLQSSSCVRPSSTVLYIGLLSSSPRLVYDLHPLSTISRCSPPVLVLCTTFLHCPLYRVALLHSSSCVRPSSTVLYIGLLSSSPRLVYDLPPLSSISSCSPPVLVLCTTFLHCPLYRVALLQSSSCVRPSSTVLYIGLLSSGPRLVYDLPPLSAISSCSPPVLVLCTTFLHCPLYRVALLRSSSCVRPSSTVLYIELLSSSPRLVYDLPPLSSISGCSPPVLVLCTTFLHCPLYRVALLRSSSCVRPSSTVLYIELLSSGPRLVYDLPPLSAISSCSPPVLVLCTTFLHCPLYRVALLRSSSCVRPSSTVLYIELLSSSPRLVYDLPPLSSISGCSPPVLVLCTTFLHCPLYRVALLRSSSCVRPSSTVLYIELLSSSTRLVYDLPPLSSISGCSPPVLVLCTTFLHCPLYRVALLQSSSCVRPSSTVLYIGLLSSSPRLVYDLPPLSSISSCSPPVLVLCTTFLHCPLYRVALLPSSSCVRPSSTVLYIELLSSTPRLVYDLPPLSSISSCSPPVLVLCTTFLHCPLYRVALLQSSSCVRPSSTVLYIELLSSSPRLVYDLPPLSSISSCSPPVLVLCTTFLHGPLYRVALLHSSSCVRPSSTVLYIALLSSTPRLCTTFLHCPLYRVALLQSSSCVQPSSTVLYIELLSSSPRLVYNLPPLSSISSCSPPLLVCVRPSSTVLYIELLSSSPRLVYDLPPLSSISSCSPPVLVLCTTFLHCPLYRVALLHSSSCVRPSSTVLYIGLLSSSPRLVYDLPPLSSISSCSPPVLVLCTTFLHCPLYRVALLQSSSCVRPSSTVLYIELLSSSPRLVYDLPPLSSISSCSPPVLVLCTTFLHCPLYRVALLQSSSCVRPSSTVLYIELLSSRPRLVYDLPPLSSISSCSPPVLVLCTTFLHCPLYRVALLRSSSCVRPSSTVRYIELLSSSPHLVYDLPPLSSISGCSPPVLVLCTTFLHCPLYRVALLQSSSCVRPSSTVLYIGLLSSSPRLVYDLPPLSSISSCSPPVLVLCTTFLHCPLYRVALLQSSSCVRPSSTVLYIGLLSSSPRLVYDLPPLSSISSCSPPVLVLCTTFLHCPLYRVALLQSSSCVRPSSTVHYIALLSSRPRLVYDLPPLSSISSCSPPLLVLCTTFLHCPLYRVALLQSSSCVRPSSTVLYIELLSSRPRLVYDLPPLSSISSCSPPVLVLCTTFLHCPLYRVALLRSSSCVRPSSTVRYIELLSSGPRLVYDLPPLSSISGCSPPVLVLCTTFLHCPLYRVALLQSSSCVRPSSTVLYIGLLSSSPRLVYDLPPLSSISSCSPPVLVLCTTFLHCPLYRVALLRSSSCVRPSSTVRYIELLSSSPRLVYDLPPLSSISGCSPPVLVLCTTFLHCPLYRVALLQSSSCVRPSSTVLYIGLLSSSPRLVYDLPPLSSISSCSPPVLVLCTTFLHCPLYRVALLQYDLPPLSSISSCSLVLCTTFLHCPLYRVALLQSSSCVQPSSTVLYIELLSSSPRLVYDLPPLSSISGCSPPVLVLCTTFLHCPLYRVALLQSSSCVRPSSTVLYIELLSSTPRLVYDLPPLSSISGCSPPVLVLCTTFLHCPLYRVALLQSSSSTSSFLLSFLLCLLHAHDDLHE